MTARLVARMSGAAEALLASLDVHQRELAVTSFDAPEHREWTYYSGHRPGLPLAAMTPAQCDLALALLDTGCSAAGARAARTVIELDAATSEPGQYWVRFLGTPGRARPWAWRVNGHHLAVHVTVCGDEVSATPFFLGAKPALVTSGALMGLRALPREEDLPRTLLTTFDRTQRETAVVGAPPEDIITRADPLADPARVPLGLAYRDMDPHQQTLLRGVIRLYLGRAPDPVAAAAWDDAQRADLDRISFAWAGSVRPGEGHYYAIRAPTFLLEYDNTQQDANHIHSVWRDLRNDWGADLLARHVESEHR